MIGFSRGAHTVRVLSLLIDDLGLLTKEGNENLEVLYKAWLQYRGRGDDQKAAKELESLRQGPWARVIHYPVTIRFCAVWDTVYSIGFTVLFPGAWRENFLKFCRYTLASNVRHAYQAMSLDEQRPKFPVNVWIRQRDSESSYELEQCWFRGTHSDVGGGANTALSNASLAWMAAKLESLLPLDTRKLDQKLLSTSQEASVTDSKKGVTGFGLPRRRHPRENASAITNESVHWSVRAYQIPNVLPQALEVLDGPYLCGPPYTFYWISGAARVDESVFGPVEASHTSRRLETDKSMGAEALLSVISRNIYRPNLEEASKVEAIEQPYLYWSIC